jgi:hypothetical protein
MIAGFDHSTIGMSTRANKVSAGEQQVNVVDRLKLKNPATQDCGCAALIQAVR